MRDFQKYKALPLEQLLVAVYGDRYKEVKTLLFDSRTQYRPMMDIGLLATRKAYLAFARSDEQKFVIVDKTSKMLTELGPLYLIWEKTSRANKKKYSENDYRWIYQIMEIDANAKNSLPVKENVDSSVVKGIGIFNARCNRCHAINGVGGKLAPDFGVSKVVDRKGADWVEKFLLDKKTGLENKMGQFHKDKKLSKESVEFVIKYLDFINHPGKYPSGPSPLAQEMKSGLDLKTKK
jgi:mono/diheme cytochrome c family protein